ASVRRELLRRHLDGFVVPRADEHLGEYVPASAERLSWLTGFTGSAGLAIVLPDCAAVFTDRRYVLQLAAPRGAAGLARRPRQTGRADRLRPAAGRRGGVGTLHRGRADHGARRPQSAGRG